MESDPKSLRSARRLRRDLTEAEKRLWSRLRDRQLLGHKFRRQAPLGPYIVDFLCWESRLVVELDGGQHQERELEDQIRTEYLEERMFRVLRFWNTDVFSNIEGVLEKIRIEAAMGKAESENPLHPSP